MPPRSPSRRARSRSDVVIDIDMPEIEPVQPAADIAAPGALLLALEGRAPWEFAASIAAAPWLRKLPRGDGHCVLVLPGLAANDLTTLPRRARRRARWPGTP